MSTPRAKNLALLLLALTQFIVVIDASITNVALPSIGKALDIDQDSLSWVVNSYTLVFGGFLLLGGRLADFFGRRRMFMIGMALFGVASLAGGLAQSEEWLIIARAVQGLGAAIASPAALSIVTTTFKEGSERNRALGIWGAVAGAGGAAGVLLGGILTQWAGWEWVLFVNVPIAAFVVWQAPQRLLESRAEEEKERTLDIPGAVSITAGLALLVYTLVDAASIGWTSTETLVRGAIALLLIAAFVVIEARTRKPLVPFSIFENRTLRGANIVGVLTGMSLFSTFFLITLYLQQVLGQDALQAGLSYLPLAVAIILAAGIAGQLVTKVGFKPVLVTGLLMVSAALFWFTQITVDGSYWVDVLAPSVIAGFGLGLAFVPVTIAAMSGTIPEEAGLASGLINTSQQIGGALGLAILASIANSSTNNAIGTGANQLSALTTGFQDAFLVGAFFALAGAVLAALLISSKDIRRGGRCFWTSAPRLTRIYPPAGSPAGKRLHGGMKLKKFQLLALATLLALLTLPASASALNFVQPAGSPYPTGKLTANSVLTGDLNGDGRDDLVTANGDYSFSSFIAGPSGALTQAAGSPYPTGAGNYALAGTLGDFTSDDNLDVAIAHNNKVVIYPGTGTGTFGAALPEITTTVNGEDITTGRFNNDSIPDLAVAGWSTNNVQIFYGNGSGGTSGSDTVPVGPGPVSIVAGDFNQDGLSDFATANLEVTFGLPLSAGAVSVVLNDDGSFSQAPGSPLGGYYQPHGITVGDFNDDGNQDITVVSRTARSLLVRLGNGDGTFADAPSDPDIWSQWGNSVASADFDGDGFGDILVGMATNLVTPGTDSAPIFLGSASGTMTASPDGPWFTTSPSYPWEVATGDFNADGHPDWVSGDQGGRMSVFMNEIPGLSASPSSLPFGSLAVGTGPTAPQSSTITSSGIGTVTVPAGAVTIAGTHPDQFDIDSEDCDDTVLNQGDSCEVSVTFSPTSTGAKSAVLQVFSDADGSPTNIALSGTGLANPDISIDPASHDFGNVPVGSAGTAVTFTVESAGTTNLNVTDVQLTGAEAGQFDIVSEDCDGASLTPGSTCEIEVDFLPTSIGTKSAELAISSNAPGDPHSVALAGEGAANTNYTLSPLTQDFGTRITGDGPGPSSTFTVTSTGTTDLETGQVSLSGGDSDQFQVTSDGCSNQTLAPNATCEIGVAFAPTSAGEKSAELWVDIQNWTGPPILLPPAQLTGSGQDPLPPPTPCEPVAVQKIAYFTPKVKRRSLSPGVRARITTAGPSVVRVSSKLIYHLNGRQGQVNYKQRQFRITGDSVNYKVAIPRKLRKKLKPGKQVRLVITYASKAPNPECTRFGEKKTRNLTTRIVRIIPNT